MPQHGAACEHEFATSFLYSTFCQWHVISVYPENSWFDLELEIHGWQGIINTIKHSSCVLDLYLPSLLQIIYFLK